MCFTSNEAVDVWEIVEFYIWQEARSQHPWPSLCFSGRSENQDGHSCLLLADNIFDISSATTEQKSTVFDRKQDLNILD